MCEHCNAIRNHAALMTQFSFAGMSGNDALHCLAVIYAFAKRDAIDYNITEEKFNEFWNELTKREMQNINALNPIEPAKFDETYDFRSELHK